MNSKNSLLLATVITGFIMSTAVHAGPPVHITFKNLSSQKATYQTSSAYTQVYATPTPELSVEAMRSDTFRVQNPTFPDITTAALTYTIGNKTCEFKTSYIKTVAPGGLFTGKLNSIPKWDKRATGSGGATCTATVTSTSVVDHSWSVVFTMK